jgi:DNA-binding transcriptional ArsR family regulator
VRDKRLKALSHDARIEMLAILNERAATPAELAEEVGLSLKLTDYHLRMLEDGDCIRGEGSAGPDGEIEYAYVATERAMLTAEEMETLPQSMKERLSNSLLYSVFEAAARAQEAKTLDARNDRHLSITPLKVDEQGWSELVDAAEDFLGRVLDIDKRCASRLATGEEDPFEALVTILNFEMPPGPWERQPRRIPYP